MPAIKTYHTMRVWASSHDTLQELARLRGKPMSETLDEILTEALAQQTTKEPSPCDG